MSLSAGFLGLRSLFLLPLLFSFGVEELLCLEKRASSPLIYFSVLARTSVMLALGFFEMENIRSFDYTPNPAMKAVTVNFLLRISSFSDSVLNL